MTPIRSSLLSRLSWFLWLPPALGGVVGCGPKAAEVETMGSGSSSGSSSGPGPVTSVGETGAPPTTGVPPTSTTSGEPCGIAGCSSGASSTTCSFLSCDTDTGTCEGPGCPPVLCDTFAQDCPEGQKCAPVITDGGSAWDATRCVPVTGDGQPGEACVATSVPEGLDDCAKGVMCWDVDEKGNGTCVEQCGGSPAEPFCSNMSGCTIGSDGTLALCLPVCSPLLQDCGEGRACYPVNDSFMCQPDASGDAGQANDPCEFINVCAAGLMCADPMFVGAGCPEGSTGCCTPFCDLGKPAACPNPDQQCVKFFDPMDLPPAPPDAAKLGVCGLPF